ncbi:hypothetical protein SEPCBS119000_003411 [Sporothrix epigloea]|uniref:Iq calmodulin-binding motif protein n=1 Tax=Sporothrix epigloea TaxID=1892477 RepID=A0ABP0DLH0_9PEZI
MTVKTVDNTTATGNLATKLPPKWQTSPNVFSDDQSLPPQAAVSSTGHLSVHPRASYREYLDGLVVPTQEELEHIADIQKKREAEQRRQVREQRQSQRRSLEACDRAAGAASSIANSGRAHASENVLRTPACGREKTEGKSKQSKEKLGPHETGHSVYAGLDPPTARTRAAVVIQRYYRGYRARREMKGFGITAETRWVYAIRDAQFRELTRPKPRAELEPSADQAVPRRMHDRNSTGNHSVALRNWKKAAEILKHASAAHETDSDFSDDDCDDDCENDGCHSNPDDEEDAGTEGTHGKHLRNPAARINRHRDALIMGLQYFLEMIDVKHRYGANLRVYHEEWKRCDTSENFFYWLDYGEGRLLDTTACPRERLDREQVRYLSREERQYYQVKIDSKGRLCWAKNGALIDTTVEYKDSIHGIVPVDDPTPAFQPSLSLFPDEAAGEHDTPPHHRHHDNCSSSSESLDEPQDEEQDVSENELVAARAAKYTIPDSDDAVGERPSDGEKNKGASGMVRRSHRFRPATIFDKLMRKSVQKNTWIFVADTSFRLYVGLKDSGTFQHSSFLQGARISAAGLIKIRKGTLVALSPLSGHYRPPVSNFRAFLQSLREEAVDMQQLTISKAYVVLVGLEAYMRTRQRGKKLLKKLTQHGHGQDGQLGHEDGAESAEAAPTTAQPAQSPANTTGRLLQKLHLSSACSEGGETAQRVDAAEDATRI